MQSQNRFFDDLARVASGAASALTGVRDELEARVFTNGCQAKVLGVDINADLALLEVCGTPKQTVSPSFQLNLNKDEKLLLIASLIRSTDRY